MISKNMKYPTGISSLDPVIKGGFPPGSFTLLLGEVGAGSQEFVYTSMLMLSHIKCEGRETCDISGHPGKIHYISFTKTKENILQDISTLKVAGMDNLLKYIEFIDLSEAYFSKTQVPLAWTIDGSDSINKFKMGQKNKTVFTSLIEALDNNASNNLIIIDSLTDLMRIAGSENLTWVDLVSLLKGIARMAKQWNCIIYALLTMNIFDERMQEEVSDCVDGVIVFKWDVIGANQLQRMMFIKKFRGLMPHLEEDNVVRFETRVSASRGFEVSNIREIMGR